MKQFIELFQEFILKAINLTEDFLNCDLGQNVNFEAFTANRDRLFSILDQISRQIDWSAVDEDQKTNLNRQIDYIKKLDEKLLVKLQEHQLEVKQEIENTVRNKDGIKGYNLNDVK
jgi:asparagine synthetase A